MREARWAQAIQRLWPHDRAARTGQWVWPVAATVVVLAVAAVLAIIQVARSQGPTGAGPDAPALGLDVAVNLHARPPADLANVACTACHWSPEPVSGRAGLLPSVKNACLACHPSQRQQLNAAGVHPPFKTGECTACHQAHPGAGATQPPPALLRAPASELCLGCHGNLRESPPRAGSHPPFATGQCLACHEPHAGPAAPTLRAEPKQLCFTCHQRVGQALALPVQHPPFQSGDCLTCHVPHTTAQPTLLRAPMRQLCFSCHAGSIARMDALHPPVREGQCASCHEPHAGRFEILLRARSDALCLSCHRK